MPKKGKVMALFLAVILTAVLFVPAYGEEEAENHIRVGFFAFAGYQDMTEDGRRDGYGYEFLQRLSMYTDWEYEYLGYEDSYAEALDMLRSGEVDIVTSVTKTPEREEEFLFSRRDIGTNSTMFTVLAGNESVVEGDYSTYDGLRIGMLEGNSKNRNFEEFAAEHGFTYEPVYYGEDWELTEALQNGSLDGIVTGSLRATENEWLIESFAEVPFYICVRRDREDLMKQIDDAIEAMDSSDPEWRSSLNRKYYAADSGGNIILTADEREYVQNLRHSGNALKVLVNPGRMPYSYVENGELRGIYPAVFAAITERFSIPYEFIPVSGQEEYYDLREKGTADIVLDFPNDYYTAEQQGYRITSPYYTANISLLSLSSFKEEAKTVAAVSLSDLRKSYLTGIDLPEEVLTCSSGEECVKAVIDGKADAAILYSYVSELLVRQDGRNKLSFTLVGSMPISYAVGRHVPENHLLISILNKNIAAMSSGERSAVVNGEVSKARQDTSPGLLALLYSNPIYGIGATVILFLFLMMIAMLAVRSTNQKRLKREIAMATEELEGKTRELEARTEELSRALKAADSANRAKTTFLNNMSHDIRTPMNAIVGYTALATTHLDNRERAMDYLEKITQASSHLMSLINDVLDMSRIESGKVTIEERPGNLAEILQGLRSIIQSDVYAKHLELFIDTVDVVNEEIFCDRLRLNQILLNLVSNAIKFTPSGGTVAVRVTQKPSQKSGCAVYEFVVRDTGIGMSPEFVETIFDPFTRERNSTVSGIQGTGLGMAITKNIVDMMGGTIDITSKKGEGTEFRVNLEFRLSGERKEVPEIGELKGLRSLVVDDDLVCCQSVAKMLRQVGMRAEWTHSGREAVIRTEEAMELGDSFHVYIVDWAMPEMDGIETVRQIRRAVGEDSPIILMSAYDWADIEETARSAGVTDFISKPLFVSDLHRTLKNSISREPEEVLTQEDPQPAVFEGKRILLVEDNELNREIATEILQESGFQVEDAENGKAACEKVENSRPGYYDLILMDIQMPVMDGYEASRYIRRLKDPALARIPIIAMTANAFEEDKRAVISAGMDGHLSKPIDVGNMLKALEELLESPPGQRRDS